MSRNLKEMGRDLIRYGYLEEGQRLLAESEKPGYPSSLEAAETAYMLEHPSRISPEQYTRLLRGQDAKRISESGMAVNLTAQENIDLSNRRRLGVLDRGDFKSKEGSVISVWNGDAKDLYLIIQNPVNDTALKSAMKIGFLDKIWGVAISKDSERPDIYGRVQNAGFYHDKRIDRTWGYSFSAIIEDVYSQRRETLSRRQRPLDILADVLINRVLSSEKYQQTVSSES